MATTSNEVIVEKCPTKNVLLAARRHLIDSLQELNLYSDDPFWSSTLTYSEQILNTRLFILFISISLLTVIIGSSLCLVKYETNINEVSIEKFEEIHYLYPNTINALCSEVSIPHRKFLSLSPKLHEVCSSEFVSDKWISSLFLFNATSHNILDYRTFSFAQFRALSLLCNISRQSVKDTHRRFNLTNLVNHHVLSREQFNEISSVLFNNLQRNVLTDNKRTGNIVSMIIAQNRLISALRTNYYIYSIPGSKQYITYNGVYFLQKQTNDSYCDCRLASNQCVYPAGAFYNWTLTELGKPAKNIPPPRFQIPGLMAGCTPLDSMRQSTLECLYNQTCVDLISLQPEISRPRALNLSLTRFSINSTIGSIFDQSLFIESWKNESNFEKYFSACAPQSLSYSHQGRFHLQTILTLSLTAFGGLVIVCKIITPIFTKIFHSIKSKKQQRSLPPEQSTLEFEIMRMAPKDINKVLKSHVHRTIYNFNLFPSDNRNDLQEERIGIITTRLYILLIFLGLLILAFYTILSEHDYTKTIEQPSLSKFTQLNSKYSSGLDCPCTHFSMSYGRIMSISARYHSICSSEYLKDYWLSYFGRIEINFDEIYFVTTDFRISGQSFFELIKVLCKKSQETIDDAVTVFKTNRLVTMNALSYKQFQIETQRRLKLFQQQTTSSFVHLIELIRSFIQTNQLAEEMWMNVGPYSLYDNQTSSWSLKFRPRDFYLNSCSCGKSNQCTRPVGFYLQTDNVRSEPNVTVPGLVLSCHAIDSLLLSTLECFYQKKCIQILIDNYDFDIVGLVHPLDNRAKQIQPLSSQNSRFSPKTKIEVIFSQLFVEQWIKSNNFTAYYSRCQPSQCTYTIRKRFDTAYMLAIMLGFCGGLSEILDIVLPPTVKLAFKLWTKRKKQVPIDDTNTVNIDQSISDEISLAKEKPNRLKNLLNRLLSLNFFESDSLSIEEENDNQNDGIITTRIYIFLFLLSMIIAFLYTGPLSQETKIVKLPNPSTELVNNLYKSNHSSLSCPCSKVAIPYSKFLSLKTLFHPICSQEFLESILSNLNVNVSLELYTHYRILISLCNLSKNFIKNSEKIFYNRELITIEPLTNSSFNIQIESLILNYIRQIQSHYRRNISFMIKSFNINQLLNLFLSNWKISFTNEKENYLLETFPRNFSSSNCSCAISSDCNEVLIDDIRIGCLPYDGFRLSKFENISLGNLNQQLFVQKWINQTNYANYFQTCQVLECQYTLTDKNNPFVIFTTLLGLYAGLAFFLRFILGQTLLAYRWWKTNK